MDSDTRATTLVTKELHCRRVIHCVWVEIWRSYRKLSSHDRDWALDRCNSCIGDRFEM